LDRLHFMAQAPDFSPGLQAFIEGYAYHFLGQRGKALAAFETAVKDAKIRRQFFEDLLEILVAELIAADRLTDAEHYVVQVAAEQGQQAFGQALVERVRAGRSPR